SRSVSSSAPLLTPSVNVSLDSYQIVAKVAYGLKIYFMFVLLRCSSQTNSQCMSRVVVTLFLDALRRMFRVSAESELAQSGGHHASDVRLKQTLPLENSSV